MRSLRRLSIWWQQVWCAYYGHGVLYVGRNRLSIFCARCGYESPGIDLETRQVRTLWMFQRQRRRFYVKRHRQTA